MPDEPEADDPDRTPETDEEPKLIPAEELFGDSREVWIEFRGERYRLRITRRNKLLLQK
jgi:hemin uptake protein HemP